MRVRIDMLIPAGIFAVGFAAFHHFDWQTALGAMGAVYVLMPWARSS